MLSNQEGGNVLSKGAYGCVFTPMIDCQTKNTENTKYVSKLQLYDNTAENEYSIGKKIKKEIFIHNALYAPVDEMCEVSISKLEDETKEECDILKRKGKKYINMKIPFVDKLTFFDYMQQEYDQNLFNIFLNNYSYLLESIELLQKAHIVHFDLKGNNILMNTVKKVPIIIDFGLSIDMDKLFLKTKNNKLNESYLKDCFYVFGPDYYVWCPEIHFINFLLYENLEPSEEDIREFCEKVVDYQVILKRLYSEKFLTKMKKVMFEFYTSFQKMERNEIIKTLLSYYPTWDLFSLSIIFFRILSYITVNMNKQSEFLIRFSKLLLWNIHPNPEKRKSFSENRESLNKYIMKAGKEDRDFLETIRNVVPSKKSTSSMIEKDDIYLSKITQGVTIIKK